MKTKYQIAKIITSADIPFENPTYEQLLESIYENRYRRIDKVPINIFLIGIIQSFKIKSLEHANELLKLTKEVVQEALEMSGLELTFEDNDWQDLKIVENNSKWGDKYILSIHDDTKQRYIGKSYMSQFFEN